MIFRLRLHAFAVQHPLLFYVVQKYFEVPACKTAMVARRTTNGLDELFTEREHYVGFDPDCSDLVGAVHTALADSETLARRGLLHAHASHTDSHRADELERMLGWR